MMTDLGRKIIDWLWEYEDENENDFNACGYDEIETDEEALKAIRELDIEIDSDYFTEDEIKIILG